MAYIHIMTVGYLLYVRMWFVHTSLCVVLYIVVSGGGLDGGLVGRHGSGLGGGLDGPRLDGSLGGGGLTAATTLQHPLGPQQQRGSAFSPPSSLSGGLSRGLGVLGGGGLFSSSEWWCDEYSTFNSWRYWLAIILGGVVVEDLGPIDNLVLA